MPRLTKIAEKAREQEALKEKVEDVSEPYTVDERGRSETAVERVYESDGVKVVEKVFYRYTRKDPITLLDTNFNVRMPSSYLELLKEKFGEKGATVFCRIAILEKMGKAFSKNELDSLKFFELLDEQNQNLAKRS
ncbi:MAG: hypothetical protein ACUVXA_02655 [Candidatus Jordarchaeum sp.]|uniref:hypothetical protein n=1 Tax=Candidatus Jordarchaeum sp. TaxID=2823881 RepID=UPI00404B12A4